MLQSEQLQAQNQNIAALTQQAQSDSASLMARYGTRLATATASTGTPSVNGLGSGNPYVMFANAVKGIQGPAGAWLAPFSAIASK